MKFARPGKSTSEVEVTNVSPHGFWVLLAARERFVSFKEFPWFRDATISQLTAVELPSANHLYWPALDVDLSVESLDNPGGFPLVSKVRPAKVPARRESARRSAGAPRKVRVRAV